MQFGKEELIRLKVESTWEITFLKKLKQIYIGLCQFLSFHSSLLSVQLDFIAFPTLNTKMLFQYSLHEVA